MRASARSRSVDWDETGTSEKSGEGRTFGAIVLAAFFLYGIGSAFADQPVGLALVAANSVAIAYAGMIGHRLLRSRDPGVGLVYLIARAAEAVLLVGGIALAEHGGMEDADNFGYLLAMIALGVGSIPFCRSLGHRQWIPRRLAICGVYGYAALAVGALIELTSGRSVVVLFSVPGGLFEVALGLYLVRYGFRRLGSDGSA